MTEQRKHTRYETLAKVKIEGVSEEEPLLKDISITGCRAECASFTEIKLGAQFKLEILPESASKIDPFDLLAESKWLRTGAYSYEIGFSILESPKGKQFQRYVDYLSWRYSHGSSMTGKSATDIPPGT